MKCQKNTKIENDHLPFWVWIGPSLEVGGPNARGVKVGASMFNLDPEAAT